MEKAIIYGASKYGQQIYLDIKDSKEVLFFCDGNENLWGTQVLGKVVYSPDKIAEVQDVSVYIGTRTPRNIKEIKKNLEVFTGIKQVYSLEYEYVITLPESQLDNLRKKRTIDLGKFLEGQGSLRLKELTFIGGGSGVLDYAFLRALILKFGLKNYLEIGTYIGESINVIADLCTVCHSVTAPPDAWYAMKNWCIQYNRPDYTERLTDVPNIIHHYVDSHTFDFTSITDDIDLYFIDGDHSYEGVKMDTVNVFKHRNTDSFVVWHDFKDVRDFNQKIIKGVYDALGEEFNNVYVTTNNMCGVYIPEKYRMFFETKEAKYSDCEDLYVYDTNLSMKIKRYTSMN